MEPGPAAQFDVVASMATAMALFVLVALSWWERRQSLAPPPPDRPSRG